MKTYYTHYKPFSPFSNGGVSKAITRATAKRLLKRLRTPEDEYRRNLGERKFSDEWGKEYVFIYVIPT